jgi:Ca2+:H+ antiporter
MFTESLFGQLVALDAEWLVESMDDISPMVRKEWVALILLPAVSAVAGLYLCHVQDQEADRQCGFSECVTAVNVSVKDQLTLSVSVAAGSTIVS